ncbi:MAG: sulfurtransferase TusA family protein [Deltaproteobacteria bacterium]|nr:sulfurtransferase TusA family protein [Deltaproteobacteria bacterium]
MTIQTLDTRRLKTPNPIVKIAKKAVHMKPGNILEVWGDCSSFEKDVRIWCEGTGRVFLSIDSDMKGANIIQIQF